MKGKMKIKLVVLFNEISMIRTVINETFFPHCNRTKRTNLQSFVRGCCRVGSHLSVFYKSEIFSS